MEEARRLSAQADEVTVQFSNIKARQVMMPAFVAHYETFGEKFRVYINGTTGMYTFTHLHLAVAVWMRVMVCRRDATAG